MGRRSARTRGKIGQRCPELMRTFRAVMMYPARQIHANLRTDLDGSRQLLPIFGASESEGE